MENLILLIIPTVIVILTFLISRVVKNGFSEYLQKLQDKVNELENILNLNFMRELLGFFVNSSASKMAESVAQSPSIDNVEKSVQGASRVAGKDIENLYDAMKRAVQPSMDLERVRFVSTLITRLVQIYGFSVAIVYYFLILVSIFGSMGTLLRSLDGIVFGVTVIFSLFVIVIVFDLTRYSGRINIAMRKLSGSMQDSDKVSAR
ncbi:MAG TPA: hypothetical protein VKU79_02765 [Thermoplasmataceae archaeon]|nr:hypothetical protein [Thermoplasmataceae archaeon]